MNIAFFTDAFLPMVNGVVTSTINFATHLAKRGHNILIVAPRPKKKISTDLGKNIRVKLIRGLKAYFYEDFRFTVPATLPLIKELKRFNADIIHFQTQFTLGWEAIMCAKIMRLPLIGTFHTYISEPGYLKHVKLGSVKTMQKIAWRYSNFFYNKCDLIISPSNATKKELIRNGVRKPIRVISNGIEISKFRKFSEHQKKSIRKKYKINDKTVLFVGRVSHEKSIDKLIESMNIVLKAIPSAKLLVVGDGPLLKTLKKSKSKNIVFTGRIDNQKLISSGLISACALFATMSKTENQPMTILEAMASGLPVVGVDKLGVPEMIKGNGYIAKADSCSEFAEYIIKILKDSRLRNKMSGQSLKLAKLGSVENSAVELEKTYLRLIA